jgi:hypothetical protein
MIDPVGNRPAQILDQEVMHTDLLGIAVRAPLPSGVLEVAHELLLLGVRRNHRLLPGQRTACAGFDVSIGLPLGLGQIVRYRGWRASMTPQPGSRLSVVR